MQMNAPSTRRQPYDSLLVRNSKQLSSVDSTLRMLSWVLPGRFKDSEIVAEALFAASRLVGEQHDTVVLRVVRQLPGPLRPRMSAHSRFTDHWLEKSSSYRLFARTLTLLTNLQLLMEMYVLKRVRVGWSDASQAAAREGADNAIIIIESVKAALRLALVEKSGGRPLVTPPVPAREVNPKDMELLTNQAAVAFNVGDEKVPSNALEEFTNASKGNPDHEASHTASQLIAAEGDVPPQYWTGTRSHTLHPTLALVKQQGVDPNDPAAPTSPAVARESTRRFLLQRTITAESAKKAESLVRPLNGRLRVAEFLHIFRPLAYILALRKFGRTKVSFLFSLFWEFAAYTLRKDSLESPSSLERQETSARKRAFLYYLFRNPLYDSFTRPQIDTLCQWFSRAPLLNIPAMLVSSYLPLIATYHYYSSV